MRAVEATPVESDRDLEGGYVDALDSTAFPLLYTRFRSTFVRADFDRFARWQEQSMRRAAARHQKLISVSDLRFAEGSPDAGERKHIAAWMERTAELTRTTCALGILVTGNAVHTGIIRALHWISPPRSPVKVVSTLDQAWALTVTTARGLGLSFEQPGSWPRTSSLS